MREYETTWYDRGRFRMRWDLAISAKEAANKAARRWDMEGKFAGGYALQFLTVKSPTGRSETRWAVELRAGKMSVWRIGNG